MVTFESYEKKTIGIFPTPRNRKPVWFNAHGKYRGLLQEKHQSMVKIGNSIAAGFRKYPNAWRKYFLKTFNLGIGGDNVQHVLWRADNIDLSNSTNIAIIQCDTNNIDNNKPSKISHRLMKFALLVSYCGIRTG